MARASLSPSNYKRANIIKIHRNQVNMDNDIENLDID